MYDNFELTKCVIVDESYEENDDGDPKATVKFIAELVQRDSREKTGFMETSTFERAKTHGGWLYRDGTIDPVPALAGEDEDKEKGEESMQQNDDTSSKMSEK